MNTTDLFCQTLYPFRGDRRASQLRFEAGEVLVVDNPAKANVNGWGWGRRVNSQHRHYGWFPVNYVQALPSPPTFDPAHIDATSSATYASEATASPAFAVNEEDDDSGFAGGPMGGTAAPQPVNEYANTFDPNGESSGRRSSKVGKKIGARLANAATSAKSSVSTGVSKTASATKSSLKEMGHRLSDRKLQANETMDVDASTDISEPTTQQGQQRKTIGNKRSGILPRRSSSKTSNGSEKASGRFKPRMPGRKKSVTQMAMAEESDPQLYVEQRQDM